MCTQTHYGLLLDTQGPGSQAVIRTGLLQYFMHRHLSQSLLTTKHFAMEVHILYTHVYQLRLQGDKYKNLIKYLKQQSFGPPYNEAFKMEKLRKREDFN